MKALNIILVAILLLAVVGIVYHIATTPPPQGPALYKYPGVVYYATGRGTISQESCLVYNNTKCALYSWYVVEDWTYSVKYNGTSINQKGNFTIESTVQTQDVLTFSFPQFSNGTAVWAFVRSGAIVGLDYRFLNQTGVM